MTRLLNSTQTPRSANQCSARAIFTASKRRCAQRYCNNGRPRPRASRYRPASPSQMPSIARIILEQVNDDKVDENVVAEADASVEENYRTELY